MTHQDDETLRKEVDRTLKDVAERHRQELITKIQSVSRRLRLFKVISSTRTRKDIEGLHVHMETDRLWVELHQLCVDFQNLYNLQFGHVQAIQATSRNQQ